MTRDTDDAPTLRDSLAFVRAASRPGSIEARSVHQCSCSANFDRTRIWNPEDVASWQADIDLACPAHGRLLEKYIERINRSLGLSADATRAAMRRAVHQHEQERADNDNARARERSLFARVGDAWRGMKQGWRGV